METEPAHEPDSEAGQLPDDRGAGPLDSVERDPDSEFAGVVSHPDTQGDDNGDDPGDRADRDSDTGAARAPVSGEDQVQVYDGEGDLQVAAVELDDLEEPDDLVDEELKALWADEAISVVVPGDEDGWAEFVVRCLGGVEGPYVGDAVEKVKQLQEEAGLEPNGIVAGLTWALILPEVGIGDRGFAANVVHGLLKRAYKGTPQARLIPRSGGFDDFSAAAVKKFQERIGVGESEDGSYSGRVDRDTLWELIQAEQGSVVLNSDEQRSEVEITEA